MARKYYRPARFVLRPDTNVDAPSSHEYFRNGKNMDMGRGKKAKSSNPALKTTPFPGSHVFHAKYGRGIIQQISGDKITVRFMRGKTIKAFAYPFVFDKGILMLLGPEKKNA